MIGQGQDKRGDQKAGDKAGVDYYETDVSLDELVEIMFEDLELPFLQRKGLRELEVEHHQRRMGYRKKGIRVHLDRKRTVAAKVMRKMAAKRHEKVEPERFPFHSDDLIYRHKTVEIRKESNAVVFCIMDTSGSMDTMKKYLARSFFFLLYHFLCTKYQRVEIVFIAHDTVAREVDEDEFFHKGESGGTVISSGYRKALEVIQERYHAAHWNVYVFHCSDGDNFESDNTNALQAAEEIASTSNLFGYGEIKPLGSGYYGSSMIHFFSQLKKDNFQTVQIQRKEDVWSSFKTFLSKEHAPQDGP